MASDGMVAAEYITLSVVKSPHTMMLTVGEIVLDDDRDGRAL